MSQMQNDNIGNLKAQLGVRLQKDTEKPSPINERLDDLNRHIDRIVQLVNCIERYFKPILSDNPIKEAHPQPPLDDYPSPIERRISELTRVLDDICDKAESILDRNRCATSIQ